MSSDRIRLSVDEARALGERALRGIDHQVVSAERMHHLIAGRLENLRWVNPPDFRRQSTRVDAGHLQNILKQTAQPFDLGQDDVALVMAVSVREPGGL